MDILKATKVTQTNELNMVYQRLSSSSSASLKIKSYTIVSISHLALKTGNGTHGMEEEDSNEAEH